MNNKNALLFLCFILDVVLSFAVLDCGGTPGRGDKDASSGNEITAFIFASSINPGLSSESAGIIGNGTIDVDVPCDTDPSNLIAIFIVSEDATVTVNGVTQRSGINTNDFTGPLIYKVCAANGSEKEYSVTVNAADVAEKSITEFKFLLSNNAKSFESAAYQEDITGVIDEDSGTIDVTVPFGTKREFMKATFITTGRKVTVAGLDQVSGVTANNYSAGIEYVVTGCDKTTRTYTVNVKEALPGSNTYLSSLTVSGAELIPGFNKDIKNYTVSVDYLTYITVVPNVEHRSARAAVNGLPVPSGHQSRAIFLETGKPATISIVVTAENGADTLTYTITATRHEWVKNLDLDLTYYGDLRGVALDSVGDVYVHCSTGIRKYDSSGNPVLSWGNNGVSGTSIFTANDSPNGNIAIDKSGRVYIPKGGGAKGGNIQILSADGMAVSNFFTNSTGTIRGVYLTGDGNDGSFLWFTQTDETGRGVHKYKNISGAWVKCDSTEWGTNGIASHIDLNTHMKSICGDAKGNIYVVTGSYSFKLLKISPDGDTILNLNADETGMSSGAFVFLAIDCNPEPEIFLPVQINDYGTFNGEIRVLDGNGALDFTLNSSTVIRGIFPDYYDTKITGIAVSPDAKTIWYAITEEDGFAYYRHLFKLVY